MKNYLIPIVIVVLYWPVTVFAQEFENVEKVGTLYSFSYGPHTIEVEGNIAYSINGAEGLRIFEMTSSGYDILGYWANRDRVQSIVKQGDYCYITDRGAGLSIIDVSDITAPVEVGRLVLDLNLSQLEIQGDLAYITGWEYGASGETAFYIVNISNPQAPYLINEYDYGSYFVLSGNSIFMHDDGSILVWDVSDPENIVEVDTLVLTSENDVDFKANGNYLFTTHSSSMEIFDISDIFNISQVCDSTFSFFFDKSPALINDYLLASVGYPIYPDSTNYITYSFDVSIPSQPVVIDSIQNFLYGGDAVGDTIYNGVESWGIGKMSVINGFLDYINGFLYYGGTLHQIIKNDNYCYLNYSGKGIRTVNVADPFNPYEACYTEFEYNEYVLDMEYYNGYIYTINDNGTLFIVDATDPASPEYVTRLNLGLFQEYTLNFANGYGFVGYNPGLAVFDFSDPENPVQIGDYTASNPVLSVFIEGNYAFIGIYLRGIQIVDISDPANPAFVGEWPCVSSFFDMTKYDNYLYVDKGDNSSVTILDVSDPSNPFWFDYFYLLGYKSGLKVIDDHLFIHNSIQETNQWIRGFLKIYSLEYPLNPQQVGFYELNNTGYYYSVSDDYIYVTDKYYFHILDESAALPVENEYSNIKCSDFRLESPFPNPFNSTVRLSYAVPVAGQVELTLYDITGSTVATVFAGWKAPGSYDISYNPQSLASGIYFLQMSAKNFTKSQKVVYLK